MPSSEDSTGAASRLLTDWPSDSNDDVKSSSPSEELSESPELCPFEPCELRLSESSELVSLDEFSWNMPGAIDDLGAETDVWLR